MVLRLTSCSPRRSSFFVTVVCASSRRLDAGVEASGPHDFAVHLKRRSSYSAISVHRIPPRVRDDRASAPLWDGTAGDIEVIWVRREGKYFCKWGWTVNSLICPSGKSLP